MSPPVLHAPKHFHVPVSGQTTNDGVRVFEWNGQKPVKLSPGLFELDRLGHEINNVNSSS